MAKGYPDYFGQSVWPKYGEMELSTYNDPVGTLLTIPVVDLTSQAVLHSGYIYIFNVTNPGSVSMEVIVDGKSLGAMDLSFYFRVSGVQGIRMPFIMTEYMSAGSFCIFVVGVEIPFKSTFQVLVKNLTALDINVLSYLGYYRIKQ